MTTLLTAKTVTEVERVPTVMTDVTDVTVVVPVGTIIDLVGHHHRLDVVITAVGRTLTTAIVVVVVTMTRSTENGHVLQTHMGDTDTMHTGVGARAPTVAPAKGAITLTYLAATGMTCPTFRFF